MPVTNEKERIKAQLLREFCRHIAGEQAVKSWRKCRITDDTAENRHRVQTDLDHGKEHAGIFLHIQNALGIYIAFISQQFKFDFA